MAGTDRGAPGASFVLASALALAALCAACSSPRAPGAVPATGAGSPAAAVPAPPRPTEPPMQKTPSPRPEFAVAQATAPAADLAAWLARQPEGALLRVPVELEVSVLGVTGAAIGFGADRLAIKLNDSALGESLADQAQGFCGGAPTCAMWVWGHWHGGTLRVTKAEGPIAAADRAAATHLFVAR